MTSTRSMRRTTLSSVVAILLCVAMLFSATWAWFTDTVVNKGNSISSGRFDFSVGLEVLNADDTTWTDANTSSAPIFTCTDWAPGSSAVKVLKVLNKGSIDMQWEAAFIKTEDAGNLASVIDVYYKWDVTANTTDITGWTKIDTLSACMENNALAATLNGKLTAGSEKTLGVALKMQEGAGKEYENLTAIFDIQVLATELTAWSVEGATSVEAEAGVLTSEATISITDDDAGALVAKTDVTIPVGTKLAENATELKLNVTEGEIPAGVTVEDGQTAIALEITLEGLADDNTAEIELALEIEKGLQNVVLYHNGEQIDSAYDADTGILTFKTSSFSPFTVVHGEVVEQPEPETEAPETEAPETEAPETEAPETEAPETEAPETEAPETEAPETEAPETEAPETEAPTYTVTWKNEDGGILETDEGVVAGVTPEYNGETPTKAADAQYTYVFDGWDKEIVAVTGDVTYTATYTTTTNKYTVTWDVDGTKTTAEVEYGTVPTFTGSTDKAGNAQYTYVFDGWDKEIVAVTGAVTYTATYTTTTNKYTIAFVDGNGSTVQSTQIAYGETPVYAGATPTKTKNGTDYYAFDGWDKEIATVTGNATYTAQFHVVNVKGCNVDEYHWNASEALKGTGSVLSMTEGQYNTVNHKGWVVFNGNRIELGYSIDGNMTWYGNQDFWRRTFEVTDYSPWDATNGTRFYPYIGSSSGIGLDVGTHEVKYYARIDGVAIDEPIIEYTLTINVAKASNPLTINYNNYGTYSTTGPTDTISGWRSNAENPAGQYTIINNSNSNAIANNGGAYVYFEGNSGVLTLKPIDLRRYSSISIDVATAQVESIITIKVDGQTVASFDPRWYPGNTSIPAGSRPSAAANYVIWTKDINLSSYAMSQSAGVVTIECSNPGAVVFIPKIVLNP